MTAPLRRPVGGQPVAGRVVLIVGMVLLGISLRHAVTGLSPLLREVREELGIGIGGRQLPGHAAHPQLRHRRFSGSRPDPRGAGAEIRAPLAMALAAAGTLGPPLHRTAPLFFWSSACCSVRHGFRQRRGRPAGQEVLPGPPGGHADRLRAADAGRRDATGHDGRPWRTRCGWQASLASWGLSRWSRPCRGSSS